MTSDTFEMTGSDGHNHTIRGTTNKALCGAWMDTAAKQDSTAPRCAECARLTGDPASAAALGTSADAEPLPFDGGRDAWMAHDFGGSSDGLPQPDIDDDDGRRDDAPVQTGVPWYVDPSANYMLFQSTTNPTELWSMGFEGPFKDIDHAQAAASGLAFLKKQELEQATTQPTPQPSDDAATFDALMDDLDASEHGYEIRMAMTKLATFCTQHRAAIRAALVGNAPSVRHRDYLASGDECVVLAGTKHEHIPDGSIVKLTATTNMQAMLTRSVYVKYDGHNYPIELSKLARIDGGGVQR